MEGDQSILDRVMSTRHENQIRDFQPGEILVQLLKQLVNKEEDIIRRRHGLNGNDKQTLEDIGNIYHLTRERIRQIEASAVKKIKKLKSYGDLIHDAQETIRSVLEKNGGAMEQLRFLDELFHFSSSSEVNRNAVVFLMDHLFDDQFDSVPESKKFKVGWKLKSVSLETIYDIIKKFRSIIEQAGKPLSGDEMTAAFRETHGTEVMTQHYTDDALLSFVLLSPTIGENPFGEYGFIAWGTIVPKRMNDKIYLVLKKVGKPLHFTKIAERINKAHFDSRKAYSPTIHNELILNDRYVLVGRGIYALKEWGYKEGVVADVIAAILTTAEHSMSREEIVDSVLKQRIVKKNTIHLALTDKTRFVKHGDGRYALAGSEQPPSDPV